MLFARWLPTRKHRQENAAAAVALKRKFALCYDSQVNDDEVNLIAEFCRQYTGRERLLANAAWRKAGPGLTPARR